MKPHHLVLTTIRYPEVLKGFKQNIEHYGHMDQTRIWIVGDRKTPPETGHLARKLTEAGLETDYLDVAYQKEWGKRCAPFFEALPWDSDSRRMIGYLHAIENGCERLISIDDDNWPAGDDFIGGHAQTGLIWEGDVISEDSGFHNLCEYLAFDTAAWMAPRGYPLGHWGRKNGASVRPAAARTRIGVKTGLWLNDPDLDAMTWMNGKVRATDYRGPEVRVLAGETWTPLNTQNTGVCREVIPAFLFLPMSPAVSGFGMDRYGDIWGGYLLQSLLRETQYHVAFGRPLVEHRRNAHDYARDYLGEFWGVVLNEWFIDSVKNRFRPSSSGLPERVSELSEWMQSVLAAGLPAHAPAGAARGLRYWGRFIGLWGDLCGRFIGVTHEI